MSSAKSNYTQYSAEPQGSVMYPLSGLCMSFVRLKEGLFNLIMPFENLQSELTKDDVYLWNKLGNSMIFPAEVKEGIISSTIAETAFDKVLKNNDVIIIPNPKMNTHRNSNSRKIKKAKLEHVYSTSYPNMFSGSVRVLEKEDTSMYNIGKMAYIDFGDFVIEDSGEELLKYCRKTLDEIRASELKGNNNCFVITLNLDKKSQAHKLAMLTYYRYLWSSYYPKIVSDTLKSVSKGIDPWDALMLTHAAERDRNYDPYYALTDKRVRRILPMDIVLENFKTMSINRSFVGNFVSSFIPNFSMNSYEDFTPVLTALKSGSNECAYYKYKCINSNGVSGLTADKTYNITGLLNNKIRVTNNDYRNIWYSISRFKKV